MEVIMRTYMKAALITLGATCLTAAAPVLAHYDDGHRDGDRYGQQWNRQDNGYGKRAAVDQCVRAAQREASRYGRARVTEISDINWVRGGFEVRGRLVAEGRDFDRRGSDAYGRYGYGRDRDQRDSGRFSCTARNGGIDSVRIYGLNDRW
jgi:hypothetical protein